MNKTGRNAICPCGSGKKYKNCCMESHAVADAAQNTMTPSIKTALEHHRAGRLQQAGELYSEILRANPDHTDALQLLGLLAQQTGQVEQAVTLMARAANLSPTIPLYHDNLGLALLQQGNFDAAIASFGRALALNPGSTDVHFHLGNALSQQGRQAEAAEVFQRALAIDPNRVDIHHNLAQAFRSQGKLEEALVSYKKALALEPNFAPAYNNIGNIFHAQGRLEEATAYYQKALAVQPDFAPAFSNVLFTHAYTHAISPELQRNLASKWELLALSEAERSASRMQKFNYLPHTGRRVKVGIVSAELGQHAVAEFLEPLLEELDRTRVHITLYPTSVRPEARAARFRKLGDEYKSLVGIPDRDAAGQIRSDQIDVLIDTTSHTMGCRLAIFAHRAAPVQCHYIGHCGTSGLTEMDYFIADENLLPHSCDSHFTERIWRLPRLWLAYKGDSSLPETGWRPDREGIIWLGTFNNATKIGVETCRLWAKVLLALPNARLLLKDRRDGDERDRKRILAQLSLHHIGEERVEFAAWAPNWQAHMALYDRLDIALDTIPFNSGTTAFDALWMGVPLVALEGDWMGGRMSGTILKAMGRPEWIAQTEEEYVSIVSRLAVEVERRKELRRVQRQQIALSPLCDAKSLARSLEDAFESMLHNWAAQTRAAE